MKRLSKEEGKKFLKNIAKFTAPALAAFFGQLAMGVSFKQSIPFATVIFWGLLADYFKKMK